MMAGNKDRFRVVSPVEAARRGWVEPGYDNNHMMLFDTACDPPELIYADGGEIEDLSLTRDLSSLVEALNALAADVDRLMSDLAEAESEAEQARNESARLRRNLADVTRDLVFVHGRVVALHVDIKRLTTERDAAIAELAAVRRGHPHEPSSITPQQDVELCATRNDAGSCQ